MSKLVLEYEKLKEQDKDKLYLFHSGIFYVFLGEDAVKMAPILNLKVLPFSNDVEKCGFPQNSLAKYKEILEREKVNYLIIENSTNKNDDTKILKNKKVDIKDTKVNDFSKNEKEIIDRIRSLDIYKINPLMAFNILVELKEKINNE